MQIFHEPETTAVRRTAGSGGSTVAAGAPAAALAIAWVLLVGVFALGHATALRNTLTVVVPVATLAWLGRDWRSLPCKTVALALLIWAGASIAWSVAPAISWSKWRTDLAMPLLAGVGAFWLVRRQNGFRVVVAGLVFGLFVLSLFSLFAWLPASWTPSAWPLEQSAGIVRPLPRWYPGPGDASMFAILCIAPLRVVWCLSKDAAIRRVSRDRGRGDRLLVLAAAAMLVFVLVTTNNRNAVLIAPLLLIGQIALERSPGRARARQPGRSLRERLFGRARLTLMLVVAVAILGAVLEIGARQRLAYLHKPQVGESAAIELVSSDARPAIWAYYIERGMDHPWIGRGFGRTVPGIGLRTESDRALIAIEPNAYIHAHNLAIDWWLQLGVVGLGLLFASAATILRTAARYVVVAGKPSGGAAGALARHSTVRVFDAIMVTLVATVARNLTDDFMVYGMASTFCVIVGALLGEAARLADGGVTWRRIR